VIGRVAVIPFLLSALVYALTMCPTVYVEGSGELIGAVSLLGTPHPTGYPLFCLLGRLVVAVLPTGNTAFEVNVASGLTCALAVGALTAFLHRRGLSPWTAGGAALVFGFSATFWNQAVIAEVYGLSMLGSVAMLAAWAKAYDGREQRWLVVAAFTTGLAATTHLSQVLLLPGIGLLGMRRWYVSRAAGSRGGWTTAAKMLGAAAVGYSLILYLPLRSGRGSGFHWSAINTPAALWDYATAVLYRSSFFGMPWEAALINLSRFAQQMATEFPPLLLAPVGWGLCVALRRDSTIAWMVGCTVVANLITALNYHRDPNGLDVFFLHAILGAAIFLAYGLDDLAGRLRVALHAGRPATAGLLAGLVVLAVIADNHRQADHSDSWVAQRYGLEILQSLPPSAVLITEGDDASFILDYLHRIEAVRPDVTLYNRNGLGTSLAPAGIQDSGVRARIRRGEERRLVLATASGGPPVFFLFARRMPVEEGFEFIPYGLVYEVVPVGHPGSPSGPIDMANAHAYANDDPWVWKIQANYWYMQAEHEARNGWTAESREAYVRAGEVAGPSRSMQFNIARILFLNNEMEEALEYAMLAVEIDPLSSHAYPLAVRILKLLGRGEEARALSKKAAKFSRSS
jgi:hypothetical protein